MLGAAQGTGIFCTKPLVEISGTRQGVIGRPDQEAEHLTKCVLRWFTFDLMNKQFTQQEATHHALCQPRECARVNESFVETPTHLHSIGICLAVAFAQVLLTQYLTTQTM